MAFTATHTPQLCVEQGQLEVCSSLLAIALWQSLRDRNALVQEIAGPGISIGSEVRSGTTRCLTGCRGTASLTWLKVYCPASARDQQPGIASHTSSSGCRIGSAESEGLPMRVSALHHAVPVALVSELEGPYPCLIVSEPLATHKKVSQLYPENRGLPVLRNVSSVKSFNEGHFLSVSSAPSASP